MKYLPKAAAAVAAVALAGGAALNAFAAPDAPGSTPTSDVTYTPSFAPTTPYVTQTPGGTPSTVTPTPAPTIAQPPVGQVQQGTLTYTYGADCSTVTITAAGWGDYATHLFAEFQYPHSTTLKPVLDLVNGAGTVTIDRGQAVDGVPTLYVSVAHMTGKSDDPTDSMRGNYIDIHEEDFVPACQQQEGLTYKEPTITFSTPSCTLTDSETVRLEVAITNNDPKEAFGSTLELRDYTTGQRIPLTSTVDWGMIWTEPGQTGHAYVDVPRGFYGEIVDSVVEGGAVYGTTITQAVNVEKCVQDQKAVIVAKAADCGKVAFSVLNPADRYAEAAQYTWTLTDAAGVVTTGTLDLADGNATELVQTAAAGVATLVVTNPDGSTSTATSECVACSANGKPALPSTGGHR